MKKSKLLKTTLLLSSLFAVAGCSAFGGGDDTPYTLSIHVDEKFKDRANAQGAGQYTEGEPAYLVANRIPGYDIVWEFTDTTRLFQIGDQPIMWNMLDRDTEVTLTYNIRNVTIEYINDTGVFNPGDGFPTSYTVENPVTIPDLPADFKEHYDFDSWYCGYDDDDNLDTPGIAIKCKDLPGEKNIYGMNKVSGTFDYILTVWPEFTRHKYQITIDYDSNIVEFWRYDVSTPDQTHLEGPVEGGYEYETSIDVAARIKDGVFGYSDITFVDAETGDPFGDSNTFRINSIDKDYHLRCEVR